MTDLYQPILVAGAASANGLVFNVSGAQTQWGVEVIVDVTAATLQAVIQFTAGIEQQATPTMVTGALMVQRSLAPAGWAYNSTTATVTLNNPGIGRSNMLFSAAGPFRLFQPLYTFTSGGGTVAVRVIGWGTTYQ